MIYLILSILSSTAIFIIFKFLGRLSVPAFPVIVYNYLFACIPGFLLSREKMPVYSLLARSWLPLAILIGILFIVMFWVVGRSSQKAGISVTTVASKMSVAAPITFSILYDPADKLTFLKLTGILLAMVAVLLIVYREKGMRLNRSAIYLPLLLFVGMGMVDSLVKFAQYRYINDREVAYFTAILFLISFISGMLVTLAGKGRIKKLFNRKVLSWGVLLGIANFGSIFFLIRALNYRSPGGGGFDSSVVFAVNNTGIVALSVLAGLVLFKESLNTINRLGIVLSLAAIVTFSIAWS